MPKSSAFSISEVDPSVSFRPELGRTPEVCLPPARSVALGTTELHWGGDKGNVCANRKSFRNSLEVCLSKQNKPLDRRPAGFVLRRRHGRAIRREGSRR